LAGKNFQAYAAFGQVGDDMNQMLQAATEPIKLPDYEHVFFAERLQTCIESGPVISFTGCLVGIDLFLSDTGSEQCVALEVERLTAVSLGDAGVANQHVSQTIV
jgi:hypothetical protein